MALRGGSQPIQHSPHGLARGGVDSEHLPLNERRPPPLTNLQDLRVHRAVC